MINISEINVNSDRVKRYNTLAYEFKDAKEKKEKGREYSELIKKYGGKLVTRNGAVDMKQKDIRISILVWEGGNVPEKEIPKNVPNNYYAVLFDDFMLDNEFTGVLIRKEKKGEAYLIDIIKDMSYSSYVTANINLYRSFEGDLMRELELERLNRKI